LSHFPNREQIILFALTDERQRMQALEDAELDDWSTLATLASPGRRVDAAEIVAARIALMHAYRDAGFLRDDACRIATVVARSGLLSAREIDAAYEDGVALGRRPKAGFCGPTPPPPATAAAHMRDLMMSPPMRPGQTRIVTPGVGHAFTTN
jgi:hypothetical protein